MDIKFKDNSKLRLALFTQLEYIESTGTQYIDTGIIPSNNTILEIEYAVTETGGWKCIIGGRGGTTTTEPDFGIWITNVNKYRFNVGKDDITPTSITPDLQKHNVVLNNNNGIITYDSTTIIQTTFSVNYSKKNYIGCANDNGGTAYFSKVKFYRIKFYENNTLVADFVPCITDLGTPGMYDTVSGTFFYNQGTGDFIAGSVVNNNGLPETILLKTTTLYHKNTPNVNCRQLLNNILNYQKTHQDEVKEYYYPTTQIWQDIITEYPDILYWYNIDHKFCIYICESDDPEQCAEDFLDVVDNIKQELDDYPDLIPIIAENPGVASVIAEYPSLAPIIAENPSLAPIIAENPEVVHSLVDTGYETFLTSVNNTILNATNIGFSIAETADIDMYVPSLSTDCFILGVSSPSDMDNERQVFYTGARIYYDYRGRLNDIYSYTGRTKLEIGNKYIKLNGSTILSGTTVTNEITNKNFSISVKNGIRLYSCKKYTATEDTLWLVPIENGGNPCMIDLLTGTKYLNQGSGSFTYSLEPKNS